MWDFDAPGECAAHLYVYGRSPARASSVAAGRVHRVAATASGFAPGHAPIRRCLIRVASPAKGPSPTAYAETIGSIAAGNSPSDER